jgi:O-antigen ligase
VADVRGVRSALWVDTVFLLADFPLVGSGVGTFETVFPAYRAHTRDQAAYAHAHMDYLEIATEGGLVATLLVLAALVTFARKVRAGLRRASGRRRLALAAVTAGVVALLLHAAVDFPLHLPGIAFLVVLMGGVALVLAEQPPAARRDV